MKISFVLIGSLSLVARVVSNQLTIQNGIDEVNQYISGSHQADLGGILYFLRNNALLSQNDYNVFIKSVKNNAPLGDVAKVVLKHLQIDQAIQEIKNVQSGNTGDALLNELNTLLNKDLFKQALLNNNDQQALINSLNNQLAPRTVAGVILRHLQIEQAIDVLKNYQLGNGNSNTLTNVLNNDLLNEGLINHQDYDQFKGQLKGGQPNQVANAVVGFLHKVNDVQISLHNLHIDQAVQVLKNYQEKNTGDVNKLFQILINFENEELISSQEHGDFRKKFKAPPINGDPDVLSTKVITVLNNKKKQVQSD